MIINEGIYRVIHEIHVFDCFFGQLKIPKGKVVEIKRIEDNIMFTTIKTIGICDGIEFPAELLENCEAYLKQL